MAINDIQPTPGGEPELNLLLSKDVLDESLWKSLVQNINDFFFPKKQAPLVLTSKPIPVKDIWGFYNYKKNGALGSTIVHIIAIALIIGGTLITFHHAAPAKPPEVVTLIAPDDIPALPPSKTQAGGGGGGGDRDKFQASKGRLRKLAMEQITPPMVVARNDHPTLAVEPVVVIPPKVDLSMNKMPNLVDRMSPVPSGPLSNGTGSGGGIGSGNGGGVGA